MSSSSQPKNLLFDPNISIVAGGMGGPGVDTLTITSGADYSSTYDFSSITSSTTYPATGSYNTIMSPGIGTVTLTDNISIDTSISWNLPEEWVDSFPLWSRVQDMCEKYPAMEIAMRNFQTVYQLVKDDYDNPTPKK